MTTEQTSGGITRRDFVAISSAAGMAAFIAPSVLGAQDTGSSLKPLKVALIGCGGRGSGAANQALKADKGVILWAVASQASRQVQQQSWPATYRQPRR